MKRAIIIFISLLLMVGLLACSSDAAQPSNLEVEDHVAAPVELPVQEEVAAYPEPTDTDNQGGEPEPEQYLVVIEGDYRFLNSPFDSNGSSAGWLDVLNEVPHRLFWHGDEGLSHARYDLETLQGSELVPFIVLPEGERALFHYIAGGRLLLQTNLRVNAFDTDTKELIDSRPLPDFLVNQLLNEHGENIEYFIGTASPDLSAISYVEATNGNTYLYYFDGTPAPQSIAAHSPADPDDWDDWREWSSVSRFLDNGNLLLEVSGWQHIIRYEVVDRQGNLLLTIPPGEPQVILHMGGGHVSIGDTAMVVITAARFDEDRQTIETPSRFYHLDFATLEVRELSWIWETIPLVDHAGGIPGSMGASVTFSRDMTRGVFSVIHPGELQGEVEKTEFYLVDLLRETVTQLPLVIRNGNGFPLAIAGDYLFFSYLGSRSGGGYYITRLP